MSGWSLSVYALVVSLALCACSDLERSKTPRPEPVPPLQPLGAYQPSGDDAPDEAATYSVEEAAEFEEELLAHFEETGKVPLPEIPQGDEDAKTGTEPLIPENLLEQDVDPEAIAAEEERRRAQLLRDDALKNDPAVVGYKDPEILLATVYTSIVNQDRDTFEKVFMDPKALGALVGLSEENAAQRMEKVRKASYEIWDLFGVKNPSQEYPGGLRKVLKVREVKLGTASTLKGKSPRAGEEAVQYWGNTVTFSWAEPNQEAKKPKVLTRTFKPSVFTMTIPRLLRMPGGGWKMSESPQVSARFYTWLYAGLHLKPEMMSPEHHPYPMSVGNFWRYRVTSPDVGATGAGEVPAIPGLEPVVPQESQEMRLEVRDVVRYPGYRVATLQRTYSDRPKGSTEYLLLTPRLVYSCGRYCKSRAGSMDYVLDYIRQSAPMLVFPLKESMSWGYGGREVSSGGRVVTLPKRANVNVPAGNFDEVVVLEPRGRMGNNAWFFKEGLGFVRREHRGNTGARFEDLIRSRILNTE